MKRLVAKLPTMFRVVCCVLFSSCGNIKSDSEVINVKLKTQQKMDWAPCFYKSNSNSMQFDDPYFMECLANGSDEETIHNVQNAIHEDLSAMGWSLSETIENTDIYRTGRPYDKCVFTIHVSKELPQYIHEYYDMKSKNPFYSEKNYSLIITRFVEKNCS